MRGCCRENGMEAEHLINRLSFLTPPVVTELGTRRRISIDLLDRQKEMELEQKWKNVMDLEKMVIVGFV